MSCDADAPRMSKGPSTLYTGGSMGSVKPRASILMTDWNGCIVGMPVRFQYTLDGFPRCLSYNEQPRIDVSVIDGFDELLECKNSARGCV